MQKKLSKAFDTQILLIGKETDNTLVWLEYPSWDCNWYWGFGYLESYTNNTQPDKAKDINCHTHFDGLREYNADQDRYTRTKLQWVINDMDKAQLVQLFKDFYLLNSRANGYHQKDTALWIRTNLAIIPIMQNILQLLSPTTDPIIIPIPKKLQFNQQ